MHDLLLFLKMCTKLTTHSKFGQFYRCGKIITIQVLKIIENYFLSLQDIYIHNIYIIYIHKFARRYTRY